MNFPGTETYNPNREHGDEPIEISKRTFLDDGDHEISSQSSVRQKKTFYLNFSANAFFGGSGWRNLA